MWLLRCLWETFPIKNSRKANHLSGKQFYSESFGVMVDNTSSQYVLAAEKVNSPLGCIRSTVDKRLKDSSHILSPVVTKFVVIRLVLSFKIQKRDGATEMRKQRNETAMKTFRMLKDL